MKRFIRFCIAGGLAAIVDLGTLYILHDIFGMWHVPAIALAFLVAFGVSFSIQKYWTFKDHSNANLKSQLKLYFIVTAINFVVNTYLVHLGVEVFALHPVVSQIIVGGLIAILSFIVYSRYIFTHSAASAIKQKVN